MDLLPFDDAGAVLRDWADVDPASDPSEPAPASLRHLARELLAAAVHAQPSEDAPLPRMLPRAGLMSRSERQPRGPRL